MAPAQTVITVVLDLAVGRRIGKIVSTGTFRSPCRCEHGYVI